MKFTGRANISAKVLCDSITHSGTRLTTLELEYPRFILAELNTHRMLSKNSASSRAIPQQKMHELLKTTPAMPVEWGSNKPGMVAGEVLDTTQQRAAAGVWLAARDQMLSHSTVLFQTNVHKQLANRITEPWMMMKSVVSGTEWANLLWLRNHPDAQPEFCELAQQIAAVLEKHVPQTLKPGEWHVPYVETKRDSHGDLTYWSGDEELTTDLALKVSASCCAQVSYRRTDTSVVKALDIYYKLIESKPVHASPIEHQATPMPSPTPKAWPQGVTHQDRHGEYWSANFRGWIQHRKLVAGESVW